MNKIIPMIACILIPNIVFAINPPVQNSNEIIGCWEKIDFSQSAQKQINEIEPWPIRYQWFCFEPNGQLITISSTAYSKQTAKSLLAATNALPIEITYTILRPGIIKTEQKSANQVLVWGANFKGDTTSFDGKDIEKGTLIMSLFSKERNKNVYYRYLKRVN